MAESKQTALAEKTKTITLSKQTKKSKSDEGWTELNLLLSERKTIWDKLPDGKRKEWIAKAKDPVIVSAHEMYVFLTDFFGDYHG